MDELLTYLMEHVVLEDGSRFVVGSWNVDTIVKVGRYVSSYASCAGYVYETADEAQARSWLVCLR